MAPETQTGLATSLETAMRTVRLRVSAYLDRWHPGGTTVQIPESHFDPAVHEPLGWTPAPPTVPSPPLTLEALQADFAKALASVHDHFESAVASFHAHLDDLGQRLQAATQPSTREPAAPAPPPPPPPSDDVGSAPPAST